MMLMNLDRVSLPWQVLAGVPFDTSVVANEVEIMTSVTKEGRAFSLCLWSFGKELFLLLLASES